MTAVCVLHIIISECDILQNPDLELLLYYIHSEVFYVAVTWQNRWLDVQHAGVGRRITNG